MRNAFLIAAFGLFLAGCSDSAPTVSDQPVGNTENAQQPETVAAHTLDKEQDAKAMPTADNTNQVEKSDKPTRWTRSGTPIDVAEFNAEIASAEKKLKADSADETLKKNLSEAFTKRGVALTNAQQYAAAIGDFRRALKYDADNEIAKTWISQITSIYKGLNREAPKEGEEPEPLEFKKEKT
jgi:tetratricopeptide (TPR) repeat protein